MRRNRVAFAHIPRKRKRKCLAEHVQDAKRLAKEHGGQLPNACWLQENGFGALNHAIRKYRKAFKGISRLRLKSGPKTK